MSDDWVHDKWGNRMYQKSPTHQALTLPTITPPKPTSVAIAQSIEGGEEQSEDDFDEAKYNEQMKLINESKERVSKSPQTPQDPDLNSSSDNGEDDVDIDLVMHHPGRIGVRSPETEAERLFVRGLSKLHQKSVSKSPTNVNTSAPPAPKKMFKGFDLSHLMPEYLKRLENISDPLAGLSSSGGNLPDGLVPADDEINKLMAAVGTGYPVSTPSPKTPKNKRGHTKKASQSSSSSLQSPKKKRGHTKKASQSSSSSLESPRKKRAYTKRGSKAASSSAVAPMNTMFNGGYPTGPNMTSNAQYAYPTNMPFNNGYSSGLSMTANGGNPFLANMPSAGDNLSALNMMGSDAYSSPYGMSKPTNFPVASTTYPNMGNNMGSFNGMPTNFTSPYGITNNMGSVNVMPTNFTSAHGIANDQQNYGNPMNNNYFDSVDQSPVQSGSSNSQGSSPFQQMDGRSVSNPILIDPELYSSSPPQTNFSGLNITNLQANASPISSTRPEKRTILYSLAVPATEMLDFKSLPKQVREMIWKFSMPSTRVFTILFDTNVPYELHSIKKHTNQGICNHDDKLAGVFLACKESRRVAMMTNVTIRPKFMTQSITFNPRVDVIFFSNLGVLTSCIQYGVEEWAKYEIKNVAIDPTFNKTIDGLQTITPFCTPEIQFQIAKMIHGGPDGHLADFASFTAELGSTLKTVLLIAETQEIASRYVQPLIKCLNQIKDKQDKLRAKIGASLKTAMLKTLPYVVPKITALDYPPKPLQSSAFEIEIQGGLSKPYVPYFLRRATVVAGLE